MTDSHHHTKVPLPPRDTRRWVKSRKLAVIRAIELGEISTEEACRRYDLSPEEIDSWIRLTKRFGPEALRTTHLKEYRENDTNFILLDH